MQYFKHGSKRSSPYIKINLAIRAERTSWRLFMPHMKLLLSILCNHERVVSLTSHTVIYIKKY